VTPALEPIGITPRRTFDLMCSATGLVLLSPLFALVALVILVVDGRPVFFSQTRMGLHGTPFRIWKFRTMRSGAAGSVITAAGDRRVTAIGGLLRKFKVDELPQLFNVLRGDMSFIGPRPEVPEYVNEGSRMWQAVLQVPPGITDVATLVYRNEEALLGAAHDPEQFYRETLLPAKLCLSLAYMSTRSLWRDVRLIWLTIHSSLSPGRYDPGRIRKAFDLGA
jgi:lipopolysaccharide/colanic/teichoic acid biosynthesis glycosyltransferase